MNIARSALLAAAFCLAGAQTIGTAAADWRQDVDVFRIGILGGVLGDYQMKAFACLDRLLEQQMKVPVEFRTSADYEGVMDGLLEGAARCRLARAGKLCGGVSAQSRCDRADPHGQADRRLARLSLGAVRTRRQPLPDARRPAWPLADVHRPGFDLGLPGAAPRAQRRAAIPCAISAASDSAAAIRPRCARSSIASSTRA